jgi:hypothetical protein
LQEGSKYQGIGEKAILNKIKSKQETKVSFRKENSIEIEAKMASLPSSVR